MKLNVYKHNDGLIRLTIPNTVDDNYYLMHNETTSLGSINLPIEPMEKKIKGCPICDMRVNLVPSTVTIDKRYVLSCPKCYMTMQHPDKDTLILLWNGGR